MKKTPGRVRDNNGTYDVNNSDIVEPVVLKYIFSQSNCGVDILRPHLSGQYLIDRLCYLILMIF